MRNRSTLKQKLLLIIFGLLTALLLAEGFFRIGGLIAHNAETVSANKDKLNYRVLCIGDSSTYGLGASNPKEYSYPEQLRTLLNEQPSNKGKFEIINLGVPGINSSQVFNRFGNNIEHYNPDMIILMIGINDSWNLEESNILKYYNEGFFEKLLFSVELLLNQLRIYQFLKLAFIPQDLNISIEDPGDSSGELKIPPFNDETRRKGFNFSYRSPMEASAFYHALSENITSMLKIAESRHIQMILMTYHAQGSGGEDRVINRIYAHLNVPMVDNGRLFKKAKKMGLDVRGHDKWHPNDLGYSLIAKSIYNKLIALRIIEGNPIDVFPTK